MFQPLQELDVHYLIPQISQSFKCQSICLELCPKTINRYQLLVAHFPSCLCQLLQHYLLPLLQQIIELLASHFLGLTPNYESSILPLRNIIINILTTIQCLNYPDYWQLYVQQTWKTQRYLHSKLVICPTIITTICEWLKINTHKSTTIIFCNK